MRRRSLQEGLLNGARYNKTEPNREEIFKQSESVVIKVGSSLLVEEKVGAIKKDWFASFIQDVIDLRDQGKSIIMCLRAINLGRKILNLKDENLTLEQEQVCCFGWSD